jgi:hypothetical protein
MIDKIEKFVKYSDEFNNVKLPKVNTNKLKNQDDIDKTNDLDKTDELGA